MKLTKAQRAALRAMFDGRCAYCGAELGVLWHADHVEPCERKLTYDRKSHRLVATGEFHKPESNRIDNFMPSCPPCNIDKHAMPLEAWREKLARTLDVLRRNNPTYRHALRFGMLEEKPAPIVFHFERVRQEGDSMSANNGAAITAIESETKGVSHAR
jgi:hypothetical protein